MNHQDEDVFFLPKIAAFLEGLEESIIYKLLDRAQFLRNTRAYIPGQSGFPHSEELSLLDLRLHMQEHLDASFGRFMVPEERPSQAQLPTPLRTLGDIPQFPLEDLQVVSQWESIKTSYHQLLDVLCQPGDDGHHGSSVEHDVYALQAIARRIHYGALYVAEAKFRADPELYGGLRTQGDHAGIVRSLTRPEVEHRILERVLAKVDHIQRDINPLVRRAVAPDVLVAFYRDTIIPLTKVGELQYLLQRK